MSIFKSKNMLNSMNIEFQNGEVLIRTPKYLSKDDIKSIINEVKSAIKKRQQAYIQNEEVMIFGEYCRVKINYRNLKKPTLTVEGKDIKISLPNKYKSMNKEEIVEKLIEKLYMFIAEKEIEMIMEKYRVMIGIAPEDYELKFMNEFAVCSKNNVITINPKIVAYKKEVIEYIILHQFCHLRYKTHCKAFYNMMEKYMPEYKSFKNVEI